MSEPQKVVYPVRRDGLRAYVEIVEKARELKDQALLKSARYFEEVVESKYTDLPEGLIYDYTVATEERLSGYFEERYALYRSPEMDELIESMKRLAYGDPAEAFMDLERDFNSPARGVASEIYRPEYFDVEDRTLWDEARALLKKSNSYEETADEIAILYRIRVHLQKYLGDLVEIKIYNFTKNDRSHSYTLMLLADEPAPEPKKDYTLENVQSSEVFPFEFEGPVTA